jgi:hypothetical protein
MITSVPPEAKEGDREAFTPDYRRDRFDIYMNHRIILFSLEKET